MSLPQTEDAVAGALITLRLWQGRGDEIAPALLEFEGGPIPITSTVLVFLLRSGDLEGAKAHAAQHPVVLDEVDWFSMMNWALRGRGALGLHDTELAAAAYEKLAPYAGRAASAGSGNAMGPVDAFLAHAAAAVGDTTLAASARRRRAAADGGMADPAGRAVAARPAGALRLLVDVSERDRLALARTSA